MRLGQPDVADVNGEYAERIQMAESYETLPIKVLAGNSTARSNTPSVNDL